MEVRKTKLNMRENENSLKRKVFVLGMLRNRKAGAAYPQPAFFM